MHIVIDNAESRLADPAAIPRRRWRPTLSYLSQTEVHVYALSIGASVLLSFFPFLIVMLTLVRDVFHLPAAERALVIAIRDYFPGDLGDFIARNLTKVNHGRFQFVSFILLLVTANGIFEPLEVALNRAWGITQNRSYFKNQVLSLGLIILCGGLALGSVLLTAMNQNFVATQYGFRTLPAWISETIFKAGAFPVTVLALSITYWVLPNRKIPLRGILPIAVMVGGALEICKYLFLFTFPWLDKKFQNEYGPFHYAVAIVVLSMITSLIVLAGAEWTARARSHVVE